MTTRLQHDARTRRSFLRTAVKTLAVGAGLAAVRPTAGFAAGAPTRPGASRRAAASGCTAWCSPYQDCWGCPPGYNMFECRDVCGGLYHVCEPWPCAWKCTSEANYC